MTDIIPAVNFTPNGINEEDLIEILQKCATHPISIVSMDTGSGKSTLLPIALHLLCNAKVFVSQPTNPAVQGLYTYCKKNNPNIKFGYEMEAQKFYNDTDDIVYCTSGHLKQRMSSYFSGGKVVETQPMFCDVIFLDEAHDGTLENDIIMGLWYKMLKEAKHLKVPRLLLASATVGLSQIPFEIKDNITKRSFIRYKINVMYHTQSYLAFSKEVYPDIADVIYELNKKYPIPSDRSSRWLVFLPGKGEIGRVDKLLSSLDFESNVKVISVFSGMENEARDELASVGDAGIRTVILSTNIAESSLTISNLDGVIDSMLEKIGKEASTGGMTLILSHISKSSAEQRKGRTGRTTEGFCYRMCTETTYQTFAEQRDPAVRRLPLYHAFLGLTKIGIDPKEIFGRNMDTAKLESTFDMLVDRILIKKSKDIYSTTAKGDFVASLYLLSINGALCIWEWYKLNYANRKKYPFFPCIVLVCLIDNSEQGYFFFPYKNKEETEKEYTKRKIEHFNEYFLQYNAPTHLEMYLKLWNDYVLKFQSLNYNPREFTKWCVEKSLNRKSFANLVRSIKQSVDRIRTALVVELGMFDINNILKIFENEIFPVVYQKEKYFLFKKGSRFYIGADDTQYSIRVDRHFNPYMRNPVELYAFSKFTNSNRKILEKSITFYHPTTSERVGKSLVSLNTELQDIF